eukprot:TRINITY_DN30432_c0_g1_i5.p2 TRINITY_DN30432_c0_g1~~TRINITY_DN30432_c0_g1_i5.p2  ORF type:complete len:165 (+),score=39.62 TRINITY_DN30432_c0_g1_i5:65-559(+)
MDTLLIPKQAQVCEDIKKATKDYSTKAQALPKEHKHTMGPPHIWVWQALLGNYTGNTSMDAQHEKVKEYLKGINAVTPADKTNYIAEHVRFCRLTKCFDSSKQKIQVAVSTGTPAHEAWLILRAKLIKDNKAELKIGTAPRSGLERQVQSALDELAPTNTRDSE